jgi:hypothetical protein
MVTESSKPTYPSEQIQELASFVENGGDLADYFKLAYSSPVELEGIDIEDTSNQKAVVREHLKVKGYKDDRIKKVVDRYEDSGTLEEEAEDALELLKDYKEKEKKRLLKEQEQYRVEVEKRQQKFVSDVRKSISEVSNIGGLNLTANDRKNLENYMLRVEADGKTRYQKEFEKDHKHMINSAFRTMKGDAFDKKIVKKASSDASLKLKKKLNASKGNKRKGSTGGNRDTGGSSKDLFGAFKKASEGLRY